MADYIFIFGRNPDLSLLEIICFLRARKVDFNFKEYCDKVAIISISESLDLSQLIKRLGGTVKIGKIELELKDVKELDKLNFDFLTNKIRFGISDYDAEQYGIVKNYFKMRFKKEKYKVIFESSKDILPSDSLKLLNQGMEVLLFKNYFAKVTAVSNPREYKIRDKERPRNDFLKSISIRLAKILINIGGVKENDILLDPFCGVGIILQEANLMSINVVGIDIDKKSADASEKNLKWLKEKYNLRANYEVIFGDSSKVRLKQKVDAIVTEPYLGPYIRQLPASGEAKKIVAKLENLYFNVLNNLKPSLNKNGKLVFITPCFKTKEKKTVKIDCLSLINKLGFRVLSNEKIKMPILYTDKHSRIDREIWVLTN